jgi:hypothetical protein
LSDKFKDLFEPFAERIFTELVAILRHFNDLTSDTIKERTTGVSSSVDPAPSKKKRLKSAAPAEETSPPAVHDDEDDPSSAVEKEFIAFANNVGSDNRTVVLKAVLGTLANCFAFCPTLSFLTKDRFGYVVRPLVDQLENRELVPDEEGDEKSVVHGRVVLAIAKLGTALASASQESSWQNLSQLVMLKATHKKADVRS